jgi:hypothetical protein
VSSVAEMAPEPVPLPVAAEPTPEECAKRFPDLYEAATSQDVRPSFKQVVQARGLTKRLDPKDVSAGNWLFPLLRDKFGREHQGFEKDYYCNRAVGGGLLATDRSLHSILNTDRPALAQAEMACKVMAREAAIGFVGPKLRPQLEEATDHAYSALTMVLGAADKVARDDLGDQDKDLAIASAGAEVKAVQQRIDVLLQRQARLEYFQGVLGGAVPAFALAAIIGLVATNFWSSALSPAALTGSIAMGALGAVISVIQRMSNGSLVVDQTVSALQRRMLGGLRPAVGAVFGAVAYFTLLTGSLATGATASTSRQSFAFFALAGFAAGFSERFATDMLERSGQLLDAASSRSAAKDQP